MILSLYRKRYIAIDISLKKDTIASNNYHIVYNERNNNITPLSDK